MTKVLMSAVCTTRMIVDSTLSSAITVSDRIAIKLISLSAFRPTDNAWELDFILAPKKSGMRLYALCFD